MMMRLFFCILIINHITTNQAKTAKKMQFSPDNNLFLVEFSSPLCAKQKFYIFAK